MYDPKTKTTHLERGALPENMTQEQALNSLRWSADLLAPQPGQEEAVARFVAAVDRFASFENWERAPLDLVTENLLRACDYFWMVFNAVQVLPGCDPEQPTMTLPDFQVLRNLLLDGMKHQGLPIDPRWARWQERYHQRLASKT